MVMAKLGKSILTDWGMMKDLSETDWPTKKSAFRPVVLAIRWPHNVSVGATLWLLQVIVVLGFRRQFSSLMKRVSVVRDGVKVLLEFMQDSSRCFDTLGNEICISFLVCLFFPLKWPQQLHDTKWTKTCIYEAVVFSQSLADLWPAFFCKKNLQRKWWSHVSTLLISPDSYQRDTNWPANGKPKVRSFGKSNICCGGNKSEPVKTKAIMCRIVSTSSLAFGNPTWYKSQPFSTRVKSLTSDEWWPSRPTGLGFL